MLSTEKYFPVQEGRKRHIIESVLLEGLIFKNNGRRVVRAKSWLDVNIISLCIEPLLIFLAVPLSWKQLYKQKIAYDILIMLQQR